MSYLKYLLFVINSNSDIDIQKDLIKFLENVTNAEDIRYEMRKMNQFDDPFKDLSIKILFDDIEYTEQDFDILREIILRQNGLSIKYIESFDPRLEELLGYSNKDFKDTTLEDQIFSFASISNISINEVENYSLYQFKKHLIRSMMLLDYKLFSPLEMSGQIKGIKGKKLIQHYMRHIEESGRYDSILISKSELFTHIPGIQDEKGNIPVPLPDEFK